MPAFENDVVVIGGCGHVGLPLGVALADRGLQVAVYDIARPAVDGVNGGAVPFDEPGVGEVLRRTLDAGTFRATTDPAIIATAEHVVVVIGTPIDEHLNPNLFAVPDAIEAVADHLRDGQALILRSTVYPGVTALVERLIERLGLDIDVAFCPERIAEGKAMVELAALPQLVSARTDRAFKRAEDLFARLASQTIRLEPEEAELAKLFTNSYRYIKFAIANQFFMIAADRGLDFARIREAVIHDYPRAADLPAPGFAAGPCLFKDTMQLAAFNNNGFTLGHSAMLVNEGLPLYLVSQMEDEHDLAGMTVAILGMAFKADSDDTRASLSYKLKRILRFKAKAVLCTDPFVRDDPDLVPLEEALERADLLVVGAPHTVYADLQPTQPVVDVWGLLADG